MGFSFIRLSVPSFWNHVKLLAYAAFRQRYNQGTQMSAHKSHAVLPLQTLCLHHKTLPYAWRIKDLLSVSVSTGDLRSNLALPNCFKVLYGVNLHKARVMAPVGGWISASGLHSCVLLPLQYQSLHCWPLDAPYAQTHWLCPFLVHLRIFLCHTVSTTTEHPR